MKDLVMHKLDIALLLFIFVHIQLKKYLFGDRDIRLISDDRINKNHMTEYFLPCDQINRKPDDQIITLLTLVKISNTYDF